MIDIHSHILSGLDDGAREFEVSIEMANLAASSGTTDIVASPHANDRFRFDPSVVKRKIRELQDTVGDAIRIHYGCDFHLTAENVEEAVADPGKYSIDHNGYLLVEFSDFLVPPAMARIFDRMLSAGLRPIVTHPERNPLLRKRVSDLESWVQRGCLMQVTAQSLTGRFGNAAKSTGDELMRRGLVHFLASDGHDCVHRPPVLQEAWDYTAKRYGEERARLLMEDGPRAVLTGADVPYPEIEIKKKSWLSFFRS